MRAWIGDVAGGDGPNLEFAVASLVGPPVKGALSGFLAPMQAGINASLAWRGQRLEAMWTAEIIADRKTSLSPTGEWGGHRQRKAKSERCNLPAWDSITLFLREF